MATTTDAVLTQLKTVIAAITTGGGYHYSLDGSDQVLVGNYPESAREGVASVQVADWSVTSSYDADLNSFRRTLRFVLLGRVPADGDSTEDRAIATARLLDDVISAIEKSYTLGGNVLSTIIEDSGPVDGMAGDIERTGAFAAVGTCYWIATREVGI